MTFLEEIKEILEKNQDKRICVLGTTCTGKSTLLKDIPYALDMDKIIFPLLTQEEKDYVCQTPWTEEIGDCMDKLVKEKIKISVGSPVFGTVIIDSDLLVYLDIDDELLKSRTQKRNVDFTNAVNMNKSIIEEIKQVNIPCISVQVREEKNTDIER